MAADRIYPLPAFVNGYACLSAEETELAKKDIDPARPQLGPGGRAAAGKAAKSADSEVQILAGPIDPKRVAAARRAAEASTSRLTSYAPGRNRTAGVETGLVYSTRA